MKAVDVDGNIITVGSRVAYIGPPHRGRRAMRVGKVARLTDRSAVIENGDWYDIPLHEQCVVLDV